MDTTSDGAGPVSFHSGPVVTGDLIITPSDGRPFAPIYALVRATGALRWQFPVERGVGADLLLAGDRVLALTMTAELLALDVRTGEPLWMLAPDGRLDVFDRRQSRPAAGGGKVFFETAEGRLHAADLASGKLLWKRDLGVDVTTSLLLTPEGLVAGLADGRLVRLSPATGEIETALALDGVPLGTLVAADGLLLTLLDQEDRLVAVEESLGKIVWRREQDGKWSAPRPTVWGDSVLMGNTQGELWALALRDGAPLWRHRFEGVLRGIGAADGVLYVGTQGGRFYAWRPASGARLGWGGGNPLSPSPRRKS